MACKHILKLMDETRDGHKLYEQYGCTECGETITALYVFVDFTMPTPDGKGFVNVPEKDVLSFDPN